MKDAGTFDMEASRSETLTQYYRFHSKIYDVTRWSFLFGRNELLEKVSKLSDPKNILEVGCGTGRNLLALRKIVPSAALFGVDISDEMLKVAEEKLVAAGVEANLIQESYDRPLHSVEDGFDLIVFSYCLSIINPGWQEAVLAAKADLSGSGVLAVVDFKESKSDIYKAWMAMNHVKIGNHISPMLEGSFKALLSEKHDAYFGVWSYFLFIGIND